MERIPVIIQICSLVGAFGFLFAIFRLIVRGRLREEYSIVWICCTLILLIFSIWRQGLDRISALLGVFYPPSLVFLGAIFAILIFLIHLSVVNSRMQGQLKDLTHEIAFLRQELDLQKETAQVPPLPIDAPPQLTGPESAPESLPEPSIPHAAAPDRHHAIV